ncbi:hypothetical protein IIA16_04195, partial [bacterium]|nr:hypothetical protein [bacterium]
SRGWDGYPWEGRVAWDTLYDPVADRADPRLESGRGWLDLRELSLSWSGPTTTLRLGRQPATWGTGDLLFVNDLFPKDWVSFLSGRAAEYLKAPSDAVRIGLHGEAVSLEVVYTPRFDADRFVSGERLSYYDGASGSLAGRNAIVSPQTPRQWFADAEAALRLSGRRGSVEWALYGYRGFWKSPAGSTPGGQATFPDLSVWGGSVRGPWGPGLANLEFGWYDSTDDPSGANPLVRNSEVRLLVGYEQEVAPETTLGLQYYLESRLDQSAYEANLPPGAPVGDQDRHLITVRLTKWLHARSLMASAFLFYSPNEADAYLLPRLVWRRDDHWTFEAGANLFLGRDDFSFFGQFAGNTAAYLSIRRSF